MRGTLGILAVLFPVLAMGPATRALAATDDGVRAGTAAGVHGEVQIAKADYAPAQRLIGRQIGTGEPIYMGDQIATGGGGGLQVMLMDQTVMTLGQNAKITIDDMVYDPKSGDGKLSFSVAQGAFRYVSGQIAKNNPQNVSIKTPMATIGIRGTIVGGSVGPDSTVVALLGPGGDTDTTARHGAIVVTSPSGSVEISRTGFATVITPGQPPSPPQQATPEQLQRFGQAGVGQTAETANAASSTSSSSSSSSGGEASSENGKTVAAGAVAGMGLSAGSVVSALISNTLAQQKNDDQNTTVVSSRQQDFVESSTINDGTLAHLVGKLTLTSGYNLSKLTYNGDALGINEVPAISDTTLISTGDHKWILSDSDYGSVTLSNWTTGATGILPSGTETATVYLGTTDSAYRRYYIVHDLGAATGLTYSTYGVWEAGYTNFDYYGDTTLGAYAFGIQTPVASMPSTGTATYTGSATGYGQFNATGMPTVFSYTATASLTADFASSTISGTLTASKFASVTDGSSLGSTPFTSISLETASFSGSNNYKGTTTVNGGTMTGLTGTYAGTFYGPNANETAGTLTVTNGSSSYLNGSYGAKK